MSATDRPELRRAELVERIRRALEQGKIVVVASDPKRFRPSRGHEDRVELVEV